MYKKLFVNLTNGIEAIERYNLKLEDISFVRIQSTHCENAAFDKMLLTLDSNFLMSLALGFDCVVYDFGAKSETSKAVYYGLEWIRYFLSKRWLGVEHIPFVKGKNVTRQFQEHYKKINKKTKQQIDYYKKFLLTNELHLSAVTGSTQNDNQPEFYANILKKMLK